MLSTILLQAQEGGGGFSGIIMILLLFVVFYFFMIRPQQKERKKMQAFREGLGKGDKVVTSGGIYGTVRDVKETYFVVEISDGVRIRVDKNFVYPGPAEAQAEPKKEEGK